ncbi:MAG: diguanylate cyclase, partial [Blastocatellia bacterium]|nr:diguanylate cyclase [Blastocatellia bacterium]
SSAPAGIAEEERGLHPVNYAAAAIVALVLYGVLLHFGIELGLVILPAVIFAKLAYNIHLRALEQKTREIVEASRLHSATVESLATAIDARDQVGVGHVRRTQIYAVGMGRLLGLSEGEIDALRTGALLHDIGKLAVPDHILSKPGALTPAEMEKMKTHSQVGASILAHVGFPYPVVPAVKHHHEMWNGAGYPDGLQGNNIPVTARILAVADAFDSLRGARPFRSAVSRDEACEFLRSRAGVQFDPQLSELFLRNLRRFEEEIDAEGLAYPEIEERSNKHPLLIQDGGPNFVEQIKRANREVFTLYSLARDLSTSLDVNETLSSFSAKIGDMIPFETCVVYLMDPAGDSATSAFSSGRHSDLLKKKRVIIGEGATGYALKKRSSVGNVDPALDFAFSHLSFAEEYSAMVAVPLVADDELIGAVSLYSSTVPSYQDEHIRLLETVGRIAADAIRSALKHAETRSHALTDPMTGLPNSRSLQMEFDKEVTRASRTGSSFQLLVLDLDGFKSVNDTYGHLFGDAMLRSVGKVILSQLREYDFLARYGGDEFVAIIPETDSESVRQLCRRIETAVSEFSLSVDEHRSANVGVSLGSASYPQNGETFDQLVVAADKAMYRTKENNRKKKNGGGEAGGSGGDAVKDAEVAAEFHEEVSSPHAHLASSVPVDAGLVVELDERHIIAVSAAVN